MASQVERGVHKPPNTDMRTILRTAGARSRMTFDLAVGCHEAVTDVVDLCQSSTVCRRRPRAARSSRKPRQPSTRLRVNLRLVRINVIKHLQLPRESYGKRGTSATLRYVDHSHEKDTSGVGFPGAVKGGLRASVVTARGSHPCG
ncbi:hypothetical protein HPB50_019451 [Hyalomma asiaticum]|uniref:Uncharacterized protein n=1 Tax=Hyalomma asiaticum TaxID=266040 RepID=A0ACB7RKC5_HYAAI|nr:hypothetical protein HPB50_019451 [Hyalomma asiaticum]